MTAADTTQQKVQPQQKSKRKTSSAPEAKKESKDKDKAKPPQKKSKNKESKLETSKPHKKDKKKKRDSPVEPKKPATQGKPESKPKKTPEELPQIGQECDPDDDVMQLIRASNALIAQDKDYRKILLDFDPTLKPEDIQDPIERETHKQILDWYQNKNPSEVAAIASIDAKDYVNNLDLSVIQESLESDPDNDPVP